MANKIRFERKEESNFIDIVQNHKIEQIQQSGEELLRSIKKLEQQIDHKLSIYGNLSDTSEDFEDDENEGTSELSRFTALDEIEHLIQQLSQSVRSLVATSTNVSTQLHQSKLRDYTQEFKLLKTKQVEKWERARLLKSSKTRSVGLNRNLELLINERGSIFNSISTADQILEQAEHTKRNLEEQDRILAGSNVKVNTMGSHMLTLNGVMNQIKMKKYRNTLVLGTVIAFCIIFLSWYWWLH